MTNDEYMLIFSLGPVQPFIAQARKTRDLWLGSLLIAKLMEAGMRDIAGNFVFPAKKTVEEVPDIPNKYIAIYASETDAEKAVKQSIEQIKAFWKYVEQKVWNEIIGKTGDDTTRKIWNRQTNFSDLFEIFWVIQSNEETPNDYSKWLKKTESLFAARKRLRDFPPQNEPGEKSALSGTREVLRNAKGIDDFWKAIVQKQGISAVDIDPQGKEHLDAIDTIKRFAMNVKAIEVKKPFPSTSSIATASFVENLFTENIDASVLRRWRDVTYTGPLASKSIEAAKDIPYLYALSSRPEMQEKRWLQFLDGDLYFHETFTHRRLEKDYGFLEAKSRENKIREGKSALSALLGAAKDKKVSGPTPYYGVLVMDGDNIDVLLNKVTGEQQHRHISTALSSFSRTEALALVEKDYPGRLVYSGGDDVFALAPLAHPCHTDTQPETLLNLADQLQERYQYIMHPTMSKFLSPKDLERMTASTGIAIAHHYTSLSYVVRMAREAEQAAKKHYGKNSLVVTIIRRSGEQTRVGCKWRYPELPGNAQPIALFSRFYKLFMADILSPKAIYTLLEEAPVLVGLAKEAQQSEIKRVLLRQLSQGELKKNQELKKEMEHLAENIVALAAQMDQGHNQFKAVELHSDERRYGLVETLGWLLVMVFLTRKDQE